MNTKRKIEIDRIRPIKEHNKALSIRRRGGEKFYQKYNQEFVQVKCPACGLDGVESFVKYGFHHKRCKNCFTTWVSPRPTNQQLEMYYSTAEATKYWTHLLVRTDNERKALQYAPRVQYLVSILKKDTEFNPSLCVDIGAGSGAFALTLLKTKFFKTVLAVDIDEDCCAVCRKSGLETIRGSIEDIDYNTVDLVTMNDLIEHLFDPKMFLLKCHERLKHNGYLSIACPNGEGFDFKIMKEDTINITPPEHLNYFNPHSIALLLESLGFEVVSVITPGVLDLQIIERAFKAGQIHLDDYQFIKTLILEDDTNVFKNFQEFLKQNKMSSHMVVIAKKI